MSPTGYLAPRVKNFLTLSIQGLLFPVPEGHEALNFETTSLGGFFHLSFHLSARTQDQNFQIQAPEICVPIMVLIFLMLRTLH